MLTVFWKTIYNNVLINYARTPKNILHNCKYNVPIDNINETYIIILWY